MVEPPKRLSLAMDAQGGRLALPAPQWRLRLLLQLPTLGFLGLMFVTAVSQISDGSLGSGLVGVMCLAVWCTLYAALAEAMHGWLGMVREHRWARWVSVLLVAAVCLVETKGADSVLGPPSAWLMELAEIWVGGLLWLLVLAVGALLAGRERQVTFNHAVVVLSDRRGQPIEIPWEEVEGVWTAPFQLFTTLRLRDGRSHFLQGELSSEEVEWLAMFVAENVQRRQAALAGEGHDLSEAAVPPAVLQGLRERS